jgi:hypothetical protein
MPAIDVFRLNHSMAFLPVGHLSWRPHYFRADARTPLDAALDCRGIGRLFCREGQRRAEIGLRLFRG